MHKRREVQLTLLEQTGLRPQELVKIIAIVNNTHLENAKILLPTLKRRDKVEDRLISIDRASAMKIQVFLNKHRKLLIKRLLKYGLISSTKEIDDKLFLNPKTGKRLKPCAISADFKRLCRRAGIEQEVCQRMFRKRFITNQVKLHLISFMDKNPLKSRQLITDSDYRTILVKVARFTGHKSPNSLFYYIDIAWDELGAFSNANEVNTLQDKLKAINNSLTEIEAYILYSKQNSYKVKLNTTLKELKKIRDSINFKA